jgi:hypothetical protein
MSDAKASRPSPWFCGATMVAALFLANCDATQQLQAVSAGQTGCAPQDIEITDDEPGLGARSWVAWCNSERYQCSTAGNTANCSATSKASAQPMPAAPIEPPKRPAAKWVDYDFRACGVTAEFPRTPAEETRDIPTRIGPVKLTSATMELPEGRGAVSVSCGGFKNKKMVVALALNGARDGMLKSIGATLNHEREIIGGREIVFDRQGEQGLAHVLWLNDRVVLATAMPLSAVGRASAKRFVNSVQLSEER